MTGEPVTSSEAVAMPSPVWTGRPLDWPGSFASENQDFLVRDVSFAMDWRPPGFAINCLRPWQVSTLTAAMNVLAALGLAALLAGAAVRFADWTRAF